MIVVSLVYLILPWCSVLDEYYEQKSEYNEKQQLYSFHKFTDVDSYED
jgi:hypothetical protein